MKNALFIGIHLSRFLFVLNVNFNRRFTAKLSNVEHEKHENRIFSLSFLLLHRLRLRPKRIEHCCTGSAPRPNDLNTQ